MMYPRRPPSILRHIFPSVLWRMPDEGKNIYLSFDDGPDSSVTSEVIRILDTYKAEASFFCIGKHAEKNSGLMNELRFQGHAIGNHTYSHLNGWKTANKTYFEDIEKCSAFTHSNLFRPPYGRITPSQIRHISDTYKIVMWTLLSKDFDASLDKHRCLDFLLKHSKAGSIIVFHDTIVSKEKLLYVLPAFIEQFSEAGYSFKKIIS